MTKPAVPKLLAWLAHLYTSLGLVCAAIVAALIFEGDDRSFRLAFLWMMIATAIDATDGWLARRVRVTEVLPGFDGRILDDLADIHLYVSLPLLLLWRSDVFSGHLAWLLVLPLLSSAYWWSQVDAKTADGFFLGFPCYWNIIAFYLFMIRPPAIVSVAVVVVFSVLTFVPTPYLYSTRGGPLAKSMNAGSAVWFGLLATALFGREDLSKVAVWLSLIYPAMYLGLSAGVAGRRTPPTSKG
jgi:phosphatidylcholine synthase